ncbi:hypothetical protein GNI_184400 [Gregarina niphandrodes]|uniref:Uncharacterized protein n=1 Tax=Gregarina niphandrodes TaxID=110365 RepID=A0A023AXH4_GRENI|nr:hypothetical protein GNI_184400 [Gregarina niphandrodes]EZG43163.1 hypothetical protein GNI_184400 [Gregarina niphandrodes]|eukprot:XP_011133585.1 hypothetical protein GNI_184400 [Gregarina niphandrodes]
MRLKTIGRQSFVQCGLAYVELGAIISGYFEYPYGIIDERVYRAVRDMMFVKDAKYNTSPRDVKSQMQMTQTRMRRCHWIVGCLLQHAGADTTRLAQFCIKELEYNPRSCTQYPLLQCLAPQVRVFCTEKDTPERLSILEAILAKLPVVSAKEYAQLTQDQLNDDMRQTAALEPLIQKDWDKASAECEPAEVDFTAGVGSEQHQGHRYPTCSRGVVDQNPLSRKRQIPQECSHLTKKKGTEGGSGSIFGEVDQCVSGAWTQPAAVLPAADVPVVAVSIAGNVSHPGCVLPRDRVATQFFYEMSQQPSTSPAIQQLERLVNHDQGSVVDDAFVNAFAEAVWKEYGPLLSPPMDHLMADVNDLPYEPACKSPWA